MRHEQKRPHCSTVRVEQEDNYSLALYCSCTVLLKIFPISSYSESYRNQGYMARCCGIAHLHLLDRRGAEEDLCLQTVAVCEARDTIKFSFHSHFSRTREGPDPKAEFLKQEMFQVT